MKIGEAVSKAGMVFIDGGIVGLASMETAHDMPLSVWSPHRPK